MQEVSNFALAFEKHRNTVELRKGGGGCPGPSGSWFSSKKRNKNFREKVWSVRKFFLTLQTLFG